DGSLRWVHEVARWVAPSATADARLIGSVQDITAQQQLSGELQQFFTLSQEILCIANQQNYFERVNRAFCRVLGYSEAELLSRPFTDFIHPDDLTGTAEKVQQLRHGQVVQGFSNRYRHVSGRYVVLEWSSIADEATGKVYASAQDITERLRLEQLKSEFVSTVSHELRTPLTSINGALALIASGCVGDVPPQLQQLLQLANNNCKRLTSLINDLLDIEKLSAGMMHITLQPHSVLTLVRLSLADNQSYALDRGITLQLLAPDITANLLINVDALRFAQVMANLLSNACKFSPDGAAVTVRIQALQQQVKITVTDTGPGIAEAFKAKIFKRFSQADSSSTRQKGGTGLGLALSKQLTKNMQGKIGFDSEPGKGASFYILFPRYTDEDAAVAAGRLNQNTLPPSGGDS
ncbi:MAG: PAS domain-containing sensor histidine kinase, partial [Rheinheimera sp.]|nr:PAS domain-containing sensor histidine kinase [Rheinheimera sp.]